MKPVALLLAAALAGAPFQCSHDPDPRNAIEETPGEALYQLAQQFRSQGNTKAWRETLAYLIKHYPSSHYAEVAKDELAATPSASPAEPDASAAPK